MRASPLPLLALALLLAAPLAGAHAVLQSADPAPNGRAEAGTTVVEFRFTEEVEREYTNADVIDVNGESMKAGPVEFDAERRNVIRLPVRPLQDGIYSASWQTLSVDTHTARGSFVFSVGNATLRFTGAVEAHDHSAHSRADIVRDGVARAVFYGGLFLVLGVPLFLLVVDRGAPISRGALGTAALFGLLGSAGGALGLLFLAERTDLPMDVAAGTAAGTSLVWRAALLAAGAFACLAAALLPPARRRAAAGRSFPKETADPDVLRRNVAGAAILLGAGSLLATSLGSHAAADKDLPALSVALDALHLGMGGVWIGGIVAFLHVAWGRDAREVGRMVHRFSPLAVASVVLLLATGTYASLRHIPRVSALWDDPYGRLVSLKVALLGVLVLFGAYNQRVLGPRLRAGTSSPRFFRRVLQVEAIVMVAVLSAAGILAATPPPDREVATGTQGPPPFLEFQNFTSHSHLIVQVAPNPVTVGIQRITIQVHPGPGGEPVNANTSVYLKLAPPGEPEPETTLDPGPERVTADAWVAEGGLFTSPGTWRLYVLLQRTDVGEFTKIAYDVPVVAPGGGPPPTTS